MANGMFDDFTRRAGRLQMPRTPYVDPLEEEHRRQRRGVLTAAPTPEMQPVVGTGVMDVPPLIPRPRLADVPPPPVQAPASPEDELQNRLQLARQQTDFLRDTKNNPVVNNDRGVLGRIGDVLRQAVISAGEAYNNGSGDPEQRLMAAIGGGIAGGFGGGFRPTMDEERQRLYDINRSQQNEPRIQGQIDQTAATGLRQAQVNAAQQEPDLKWAQIRADVLKNTNDATAKLRGDLVDQLKLQVNSGGYDPKIHTQLRSDLARVGINADTALSPNDKFYATALQNGGLAIVNTRTGESTLGLNGQTFEKPTTVTESDLDDSRFPWLRTDKDIQLQAQSELEPELNNIEVNETAVNDLLNFQNANNEHPYQNEDGTFNKNKFLQDAALGLAPMQYNNLYRGQTRSLANKLARRQSELLDASKGDRAELAKFRIALKGKPTGAANTAIDLFNAAMQTKDKKEKIRRLKALYSELNAG